MKGIKSCDEESFMEASESSGNCEFGCEIENFRGEKDGTSPGLLLMLYLKMTPKSLSNV